MKYKNENWLRQKYCVEGMSQSEIADICGCAQNTVSEWVNKFGIDTSRYGWGRDDPDYADEEWLEERYVDGRRSIQSIAEEQSVHPTVIYYWLEEFGIERRSLSEAFKLHWEGNDERKEEQAEIMREIAWEGGVSGGFRQTKRWHDLRKEIYERDGYRCQECGEYGELHAHHVTPVYDGGNKWDRDNLVTLCRTCHIEVHSNGGD